MSNDSIATLPRVDNCFGGCPTCHETDGFLNIGRDHWFVCHRHRVKWHVGSNLFSGWRRLLNSNLMMDQTAINAGFDFRRYAMKPMPAKPRIIMAHALAPKIGKRHPISQGRVRERLGGFLSLHLVRASI
jgi:hypothetical protein